MNRPTRKRNHLLAKVENQQAQGRKAGKRTKRWQKWIETYKEIGAPAS